MILSKLLKRAENSVKYVFPLKGGLLFDASQITHAHKENKEKEFKSEYR